MKVNGVCIDLHRFIMEQHLGRKLMRDEVVHHIDGNPDNNDLSNLTIMSMSEHSKQHVTQEQLDRLNSIRQAGENTWSSKLKVEDVVNIRKLIKEGKSISGIARMFGVVRDTIQSIRDGKSWASVV